MGEPAREDMLPKVNAELVLLRVFLSAHLDGMPPKERMRFIRRVNRGFEERLGLVNVEPINPPAQFPALKTAQLQAHAWWCKAVAGLLEKAS